MACPCSWRSCASSRPCRRRRRADAHCFPTFPPWLRKSGPGKLSQRDRFRVGGRNWPRPADPNRASPVTPNRWHKSANSAASTGSSPGGTVRLMAVKFTMTGCRALRRASSPSNPPFRSSFGAAALISCDSGGHGETGCQGACRGTNSVRVATLNATFLASLPAPAQASPSEQAGRTATEHQFIAATRSPQPCLSHPAIAWNWLAPDAASHAAPRPLSCRASPR